MSTNLPSLTPNSKETKKQVMQFLGQSSPLNGDSAVDFPSLRVNYDDEDSEGNVIPRGHWTFSYNGRNVYSSEVFMRIMFVRMQYSHYNQEKRQQISTSIYFTTFGEEVPDDTGGMKCGKLSKRELDKLSESERKIQSEIKLSKVLFGFVSADAKTSTGEDLKIQNYPVVFYARGTHYMPIADYLDNLTREGILMLGVQTKFTLNKRKNGSVTYWEVVPSIGENIEINLEQDQQAIKHISDMVEEENRKIIEKWSTVRAAGSIPTELINLNATRNDNIARSLDEDFDDEINL